MFRHIAVTNRALCAGDFLTQVDRALATGPAALILWEKDLSADGYQRLAEQVQPLCARRGVACILHTFAAAAAALPCQGLHLSLPGLRALRNAPSPPGLPPIGASVHSLEEAQEACALGAAYLTAGHIFDTGCKPGLPGRGLGFLAQVCAAVPVPVYAIGGIHPGNLDQIPPTGAAGACMMSYYMTL